MTSDPSRDFDFLAGSWRVHHRQLERRLGDSTEWVEFDGTCMTQPILGGMGNVDDNVVNVPSGPYRAATLRAFDSRTRTWTIWWLDSRYPNRLDPPLVGAFKSDLGTFFADDTFNGKPIKVRFIWTMNGPDACHWEQAFSPDSGNTWETNWTMDFARAEPTTSLQDAET
jgi:hypothetical protein